MSRSSSAQLAALREDASCAWDGESPFAEAHQATKLFLFLHTAFPTKIQLWDGFLVKRATDTPLLRLNIEGLFVLSLRAAFRNTSPL